MARGDKSSYSPKQRRKAHDIEEGYEDRGVNKKEAEHRAWATVNKQSSRGKSHSSSHKKS
jgi:plasmid stabilization system protein ParE